MSLQNGNTLQESIEHADQQNVPLEAASLNGPTSKVEQEFDILVVDDRQNWSELIVATFDGLYNCDTAANYREALKKIRSGKYRVITMNWWLPTRNDGWRLLGFLCADYPDIPVVLVTGEFQGELEEIGKIKSRYPNIKKILIKGHVPNQESQFVTDLLGTMFELLGKSVSTQLRAQHEVISENEQIDEAKQAILSRPKPPRSVLTWLHLSDLHIGCKEAGRDWESLKAALLDDVQQHLKPDQDQPAYCAQTTLRPDVIFVTGDIAYRADEKEFLEAEIFIKSIWDATGLGKEQTFVVPGNHDTDRKAVEEDFVYSLAYKVLANPQLDQPNWFDALNKLWQNKLLSEWLEVKFRRYKQFANVCMTASESQLYYARDISVPGGKIGILGLNSALMSWKDGDDRERGLWIGTPQLDEIEKMASKDVLFRIALVHHPREALHEHDGAWDYLQQSCLILLHGHMHKPKVTPSGEPEREHICLPGGSVHEGGVWRYQRYSYGQLDLDNRNLDIYLRMTRPSERPLYIRDNQTYPKAAADGHLRIHLLDKPFS